MKQKHLISLKDLSRAEIEEIFDLATKVKANPSAYASALKGKSLAMVFQKPSTRTRVSFEVGMFELGGTDVIAKARPRDTVYKRESCQLMVDMAAISYSTLRVPPDFTGRHLDGGTPPGLPTNRGFVPDGNLTV